MAHAYRKLGRDEDALVGFRRFLDLDPKNAQVHYEIAQILLDRGKNAEASADLKQALAVQPTMAAARNALGVVALNEGDVDRAETRNSRRRWRRIRTSGWRISIWRWWPRSGATGPRRSCRIPARARAPSVRTTRRRSTSASSTSDCGDKAAQEAAYRKAIDANAEFAEGYFYLAKLLLDRGQRFDEAVTLARKGLEIGPRSEYAPLGHYVLADLYSRMGKPAEAAAELQRGRALERVAGAHTSN